MTPLCLTQKHQITGQVGTSMTDALAMRKTVLDRRVYPLSVIAQFDGLTMPRVSSEQADCVCF